MFEKFFENSENCLKIARTIWEFRELFETSENCLRVFRTSWDFRELFKTSENCLRVLRTAWDFRELFKNSENCLKIPRTVWEFPELSKNFLELFDTSVNYLRFWEHLTRNNGREQWPIVCFSYSVDLIQTFYLVMQD